jgi:hypothetical protein
MQLNILNIKSQPKILHIQKKKTIKIICAPNPSLNAYLKIIIQVHPKEFGIQVIRNIYVHSGVYPIPCTWRTGPPFPCKDIVIIIK